MNYRSLGKTAVKVSEISMGCMSLKGTESEDIRLIHQAIDYGVNYFDTADLYDQGQNEILVGKAIKDKREDVVLATKVGNRWRKDGSGWDWVPSKSYIMKALEDSLQRLQTEYIDLYQLHGGTIEDPIDEIIEAFELLQEQGKIRYYGISSIRPNVIREYVRKSNISSVMMQYSLLDRRPEESCLQLLAENQISVIARGTLAKGMLAGKPSTQYLSHNADTVQQITKLVDKLSNGKEKPSQLATAFVLNNKAITSAVMGFRTQQQMEDVLQGFDIADYSSEIIEKLNDTSILKYEQHR